MLSIAALRMIQRYDTYIQETPRLRDGITREENCKVSLESTGTNIADEATLVVTAGIRRDGEDIVEK